MKSALQGLSIALVLAGCGVEKKPPFPVGTWLYEVDKPNGWHFESKTSVASDGRYICHGVTMGTNQIPLAFEIEGTLEVREGFVIDTMTKSSETNAPVPVTHRQRIVRMDGREMVLNSSHSWETNLLVFRKISP
jgi:hypothetical protein